jgi:maleate cis-trans isomerase
VTNPSLAFSVNRFDRVLRCTALNGDGENIVSNLNLKNKSIEEAVKMTIQEIAAEGYLSDEEPEEVVIATASADLNKSHQLARELNQTAAQAAAEKNVKIETRANSVGQKSVQKAKELGTTPGARETHQKSIPKNGLKSLLKILCNR